ncbi:MAG TPA: hypothetical protein VEB41_01720 [Burkholderiales bacterium]|nr:hypothetical protein [Burkholderiales bacterium]
MNQKQSEGDPATADAQQRRIQKPGAQGMHRGADAIKPSGDVDEEKLKENQRRLNVDKEHKTPEMKKGHRGTFP